jgi:hypothetical protein
MDDTALLFAGAQFSGSHIEHYKTRLTAASQQIPTLGPFFRAWSRFGLGMAVRDSRPDGRKGSVFSESPLKHWWGPLAHNLGPHHQPSHLAWD